MKYQRIKGTVDILPYETGKWIYLEEIIRSVMARFNYKEIRVPVFETTELFARGIGEGTDIVNKEMYTFTDMGGRSITLRPEATASVVRCFIEESLGKKAPLTKVYYIGPMFRQEKPQKGRQRQFYQFGAEALGSADPRIDAEIIAVSVQVLKDCGINQFEVALNSVATPPLRAKHREKLLEFVRPVAAQFPEVDREKIDRNPLRLFDSKLELTQQLLQGAPLLGQFYDDEVLRDFDIVKETLTQLGIPYAEDPRLVRGLDYYTKTAFEIRSSLLGAQDALSGGGRYDLLVEELGGDPTPAVGFAAGMERTLLAIEAVGQSGYGEKPLDIFIIAESEPERKHARLLAKQLRDERISVDLDYLNRSQKAQIREASRQNARFALFVFADDIPTGKFHLKKLATGDQQKLLV
ncbi:MAG: histidine--tRNA ligase, partial [candidate division Zixibacteria bacterium]|nr:histidine--tRNA ligase [candidate division Zixibacteria bacterium]